MSISGADYYAAKGLCRACGKQPEPGKTKCSLCAMKAREYHRVRRETFVAAGKCHRCQKDQCVCASRKKKNERTEEELARYAAQRKARGEAMAAAGFCVCGAPRKPGQKSCAECIGRSNDIHESRRAAGLCVKCGSAPRPGRRTCGPCSSKRRAYYLRVGR